MSSFRLLLFSLLTCISTSLFSQVPELLKEKEFINYNSFSKDYYLSPDHINPGDFRAKFSLAWTYIGNAKYEKALKELRDINEIISENADVHYMFAVCKYYLKENDSALFYLTVPISEIYNYGESHLLRASIYLDQAMLKLAKEDLDVAKAIYSKDRRYYSSLIRYYQIKKQDEVANELIDQYLSDHPDNEHAVFMKSNLALSQGDTVSAINYLNQLIEKDGSNGLAYFNRAKIYLAKKEVSKAIEDSKLGYDKGYRSFSSCFMLAYNFLLNDSLEQGLFYLNASALSEEAASIQNSFGYQYNELVKIGSLLQEHFDDLNADERKRFNTILKFFLGGKINRFVSIRKVVEARLESEVEYRIFFYNGCYTGRMSYDSYSLDSVMKFYSDDIDLYNLKYLLYDQVEKYDEAEEEIEKMIKLDNRNEHALRIKSEYVLNSSMEDSLKLQFYDSLYLEGLMLKEAAEFRGRTYLKEWKIKMATPSFEDALWKDPYNEYYFFSLSYCYVVSGQNELAVEFCDRALEFNPDNKSIRMLKAVALNDLGRSDEAIKLLDDHISDSRYTDVYKKTKVELLVVNKRCKKARSELSDLFLYKNLKGWFNYQKARCFMNENEYGSAAVYIERALAEEDSSNSYITEKAFISCFTKKLDGSISELEKVIERNENYVPAKFTLGLVYLSMNKEDEAVKSYEEAIDLCKKQGVVLPEEAILHHDLITSADIDMDIYNKLDKILVEFKEGKD